MIKIINKNNPAEILIILGLLLFVFSQSYAQSRKSLTIDICHELARNNYPLLKQMELIEKTKVYSLENLSKGYLPQINMNGQATYQSEVTNIPISIPNLSIPSLSKDQYRIYGEINQSLTDGFTIKQQKALAKANAETENQKIEVELYKLKERINQLYFGILLLDAQLNQTDLVKKDIQSGIDKTNAAIENGTILKTNAVILNAELLKANQRTIELKANRKAYTEMISLFINQEIDESTKFETPVSVNNLGEINRPELKLYDFQKKSFEIQNNLINARNLPRLGLFFQGGYGRPALNQLSNNFNTYYIGGLRLSWNLTGFYTAKKEKELLKLNQNSTDIQKEIFLLNTHLALRQQNSEVSKFKELIGTDDEIIKLREKVKQVSNNQLENGTITTIDYLTIVNAEDQARQNQLLHQIQLLLAQYNYQTTSGN